MTETTTQEVSLETRLPLTGSYKRLMVSIKSMLERLTVCNDVAAHMAAHACGCEFGRLNSQRKDIAMKDVKIGKVSKDGLVTVSEAASKFKGVYLTNGLRLIKILAAVVEVEALGAEIDHLKLPQPVQTWIDGLGKGETPQE